ncbi:hypothetical protein [Halopenitus persicus]|uniref:hypothetical protein n=1 Tax=Halopenitus persicus TaxID=1048396 RepID=UPI000BBA6011|nr:hypothetical protein [Halopenitus persicus]
MSSTDRLTPQRRDALRAVIALALLAGPLWIPALHLGDPTYRYERAQITDDGSGVAFENESAVPAGTILSEEIACAGTSSRACAFERHLARNNTVLTPIYSSTAGTGTSSFAVAPDSYDYVQINGTVYEATTVANRSRVYVVANRTVYEKGEAPEDADTSGDLYRVELSHRQAPPAEVLFRVSRDVDTVPSPIAQAARTGTGVAHRDLDVPKTPIRTAEDTYYRVFRAGQNETGGHAWLDTMLTIGTPIAGLIILVRLRRRVEITHVGTADPDDQDGPS